MIAKTRPWLWPNLLSLDAPIVAILWQLLVARCLGLQLNPYEIILLGAAVWLIYAADRVLDAMRSSPHNGEPTRLLFYRRNIRTSTVAVLCAALAIAPLAHWLLAPAMFRAGLWLAAWIAAYIASIHLVPLEWRSRWPREFVVALFFTIGTFLAIWIAAGEDLRGLAAPAALFLLLCWVNCCAIEFWESPQGRETSTMHASTRWLAMHSSRVALSIAVLSLALEWASLLPSGFFVAPLLSGAAFYALTTLRPKLAPDFLRVAADLALCTPVLVFPFLWLH